MTDRETIDLAVVTAQRFEQDPVRWRWTAVEQAAMARGIMAMRREVELLRNREAALNHEIARRDSANGYYDPNKE